MGERKFVLGAAVLVLASVFVATPAHADDDVHVIPIDPLLYDDPQAIEKAYDNGRAQSRTADPTASANCGGAAAAPVPDGADIVVSLPPAAAFTVGRIDPATWRNPPVTDPTWRLNYESLNWMKPLARRAGQDGQTQSLATLVDQVVKFHAENPDPGTTQYGWDEAAAQRRLETESCLYALTGSETLIPGMERDAAVLLGPRYYGPPGFSIHNHGLMANLTLARAADLIDRPAWKTRAVERMTAEAPQAFSSKSFGYEQSSGYQLLLVELWEDAADVIEAAGGDAAAVASIRAITASGRWVYRWMTEPDGKLVQVGDTSEDPGEPANPNTAPRTIHDTQTGWIIGRWSWTDANTTYYTVRFGPPRRAHGHHDRAGGVTFTARGVRVLVGPGRYNYNKNDTYNIYQLSPNAHNMPIPNGRAVTNGASSLSDYVVQSPAHGWTIRDRVFGVDHSRNVNVNHTLAQMKVVDTFPGQTLQRQYWHLDPAWVKVSAPANGKTLTFSHPSGRRLTITTTGLLSGVVQGQTRPPAGWHFPQFGQRVWANEITIRQNGPSVTTTFVVS